MNKLSLKNINENSPYEVTLEGENSYAFTTDYGIEYEFGFIEDFMLGIENVYQFFLMPKNGVSRHKDPKIILTVYALLEEFFSDGNLILDYICDTSDGRQEARNRLFEHWYKTNPRKIGFTLEHIIAVYDNVSYYAAVIMRNDNPRYSEIMDAINAFTKNIGDKLK